MKVSISALAIVAALGVSAASFAQVPTGGADAKGNAPLKAPHTLNDGGAKKGATSFTQGEARKHIERAGYTAVSPLEKGRDGVWRGTAMHNGATVNVGLDFKGNVVEAGPAAAGAMQPAPGAAQAETGAGAAGSWPEGASKTASADAGSASTAGGHHRHRRHRHHHAAGACAQPGPNGAACSGVDRNRNGVSDKEDRAIKAGAKP